MKHDFVPLGKFDASNKNKIISDFLVDIFGEKMFAENLSKFDNELYDFAVRYNDDYTDFSVEIFDKLSNFIISYRLLFTRISRVKHTIIYNIPLNSYSVIPDELFVYKNCTDEQEDEILFNLKMYVL